MIFVVYVVVFLHSRIFCYQKSVILPCLWGQKGVGYQFLFFFSINKISHLDLDNLQPTKCSAVILLKHFTKSSNNTFPHSITYTCIQKHTHIHIHTYTMPFFNIISCKITHTTTIKSRNKSEKKNRTTIHRQTDAQIQGLNVHLAFAMCMEFTNKCAELNQVV